MADDDTKLKFLQLYRKMVNVVMITIMITIVIMIVVTIMMMKMTMTMIMIETIVMKRDFYVIVIFMKRYF